MRKREEKRQEREKKKGERGVNKYVGRGVLEVEGREGGVAKSTVTPQCGPTASPASCCWDGGSYNLRAIGSVTLC